MTIAADRPVRAAHVAPGPASNLLDLAKLVHQNLPGYRPEILGGRLVVNPPPDGRFGMALTSLTLALAHLHGGKTRVAHHLGLWLPTGDEDYVVPDLAVVDADAMDHMVTFNCLAPRVFHMAVEITSVNWRTDMEEKPAAYAAAGVPVYLIGDRSRREVVLLTDPRDGEYRAHAVYRGGETFTLPHTIGGGLKLDTNTLLG